MYVRTFIRTFICMYVLKNCLYTIFCSLNSVLCIDYCVEPSLAFYLLVNQQDQNSEAASLSEIESVECF